MSGPRVRPHCRKTSSFGGGDISHRCQEGNRVTYIQFFSAHLLISPLQVCARACVCVRGQSNETRAATAVIVNCIKCKKKEERTYSNERKK